MSNYSKGLPQNNIRYRTNKSPDAREQRSKNMKNIFDKKLSVVEEMQQMKQRREDRKKRIEEEKQHKKVLQIYSHKKKKNIKHHHITKNYIPQ